METMYKYTQSFLLFSLMLLAVACSNQDELEAKKEKLKELKKTQHELKDEITALEKEISMLDPNFARANRKATLVTSLAIKKGEFEHYVEVNGTVVSNKNILLSAENMGNILKVHVTEGSMVKANQVLVSMDTELLGKQLKQEQTQLELAETLFQRQKNLWDKNIGTEVQFLEAKNRVESLETQISNIKSQISKSQIKAPFAGMVEKVLVNAGEMASVGTPLLRIVGQSDMYIEADLSETYIGMFKTGDPVSVHFPSIDKKVQTKVRAIGQVVDSNNRTFRVETDLPKLDYTIKPNMIATMRLRDHYFEDAVTVPTNLIQRDNKGDYIYVINGENEDKQAKKIHIERGITYQSETMITGGLNGSELLVNDGYREVIDGMKINIVDSKL